MKFYSTNKKSKLVDFKTALLRGLADDGGLYMPRQLPQVHKVNEVFKVRKILGKFMDMPENELEKITKDAFNFPAPLVKLDENLYILELFYGPTLSFKDFGARFMARAMEYYVNEKPKTKNQKLNIIAATSGDTGSAAANGFYGLSNIRVFVLYPSKRISDLQEKQIATLGKNIVALEVKGDFDDCQRLAKTVLSDQELRKKINISSANSINIGRLLPQMYYYFAGYQQLKKLYPKPYTPNPIFVVPSGNFGNLTAGLFAKKIGLPIKKFIAAVNVNSGVPEFLKTGKLPERKTKMTYSSAMDVGKPSNWARIRELYDHGHDYDNDSLRKGIAEDLEAITITEPETKKTIAEVYKKYNYIIDPHTAVGVAAAQKSSLWSSSSFVVLSTAHPAKFKEIVESAIGKKISLPPALREVVKKKKKSFVVAADYQELRKTILHFNYCSSSF